MATQNFFLHVHTSADIIRKMTLTSRPASVDELKNMMKAKFKLDFDFRLSYEDPDFDRQLCSLVEIEELPQKAVLKIIRTEPKACPVASDDSGVVPQIVGLFRAAGCTEIVISENEAVAPSDTTIINPDAMSPVRAESWPSVFPVPTFSYHLEAILNQGNIAFSSTGKTLTLSKGQKHELLEALAIKMHSFKAYPSDKNYSTVAEALVTKHPCLKEPGSQTGWEGWKNSLKFKMGNYRSKLSRAGFHEVAVNSGKRSRDEHPHANIKRPKRAEVNFLPNFPKGEDGASLERLRLQMVDELQTTDVSLPLVSKLMDTTFALRRREVIHDDICVVEVLERWPALKMDSELCAEFYRITNVDLIKQFYTELDRHSPSLERMFRKRASRSGRIASNLEPVFTPYDLQKQPDIHVTRAAVLRALPAYLSEDDSNFLRQWNMAKTDEPNIDDMHVGLLVIHKNSSATFLRPKTVVVVLGGKKIMEFGTFEDAFIVVFALIYTLNLDYPRELANTFEFVQKVLIGLDDGRLKSKILTLKNAILSGE